MLGTMKVRGCLLTFLQLAILWTGMAQGKSSVRLLVADSEAPAGSEVLAAIELTPPKGWHTYWRNPGDSGQRTKVQWTLPDGITAGDLLWPAPAIHSDGGLTTYVYEGRVLLPLRLRVASNAPAGPLALSARVSWLECEKECVPGRATVKGAVRVGPARVASPDSAAIESAIAGLPQPDPGLRPTAAWDGPASGDERPLLMSLPASAASGFKAFLPYEHSDAELGANPESVTAGDGSALVRVNVIRKGADWPAAVAGLFAFEGGRVVEAEAPIAPATIGSTPEVVSDIAGKPSLLWMLGFAFLGGLILNVMPCVLPVIALKILGFVKQSQEQPRRVRVLGLVYTLGVLCSFAVLALVVIGLQSAGRSANWGMQFQNPVFVVLITTLVTLVALNLFGVFEITLTAGATGAASGLASRGGVPGAFFNGVFTTILATPCTAPFLGVALGFAFSQPPALLLLMFLTAGLGLAAPYLVLSVQPGWLKFLPRPGNWMITFKMLMGFPMLGTAIWLLTLAPDHFGPKGVFWLGMFLLLVALAAWLYGRSIQAGQGNRTVAWTGIAAALVAGLVFILEGELQWRSPPPIAKGDASGVVVEGGIAWAPWSPAAIQAAQAKGHPVLVDFTAKWCATCQFNKKKAIQTDPVLERLRSLNVVTLRGDYTREDPAISEELQRFKRAGVPLVLVYPGRPGAAPRVLPELLTTGLVLDALDWAERTEAMARTP